MAVCFPFDNSSAGGAVTLDGAQFIDAYCERVGPGFWAEPLNAVTNAAFVVAAFVMWHRLRGTELPLARLMVAVLAVIGAGSFLFHTFATPWAALADVLPIAAFILLYLLAVNLRFLAMPPWLAALAALLFLPLAAVAARLIAPLPFLGISAPYWPVVLLIAAYALLLRRRAPATARGLGIGAVILTLSLTFRSLDGPLCAAVPIGTHFLWHVLNAVMLGWMIEVYRRHMVAGGGAGR